MGSEEPSLRKIADMRRRCMSAPPGDLAQVQADRIKLKRLELTVGSSSKEKPTVTRAVTVA
jgi:hypothetical protein